ncbi:unnamed protein product, partial [Vitis vinifera]|uniref:Uncharacterized protein n=1 Tax=Vitis vinifera TaxID=29760 RepID=D7SRM0_VITVI
MFITGEKKTSPFTGMG